MSSINVTICVCTRDRPKMFKDCIDSLLGQKINKHKYNVSIVVVNNNSTDTPVYQVNDTNVSITYVREETIGLVVSRNRAVRTALEIYNPDFIAMIDDDEMAKSDWLAHLLGEQITYDADIVFGLVHQIPESKWTLKQKELVTAELDRKQAPTNCTLFKCSTIFKKNIFFNEKYNLTGAEDTELTRRVKRAGGLIVRSPYPQVYETTLPERRKLKSIINRWYWNGTMNTRVRVDMDGWFITFISVIIETFQKLLKGIGNGILAVFTLSRQRLLESFKNFAHLTGGIRGLLWRSPEPYKNVIGR